MEQIAYGFKSTAAQSAEGVYRKLRLFLGHRIPVK